MNVGLSVSVIQRGRSGVATYVAGLLRGLESARWPVEVTLFGLDDDRGWFAPWIGPCRWVGVPEAFRPAVRNVFWHQTVLPGLLKRHRCDILHVPSYRRLVARPGIPEVATIHDCAPFRLAGKYDTVRMLYGRHIVTRLARRAAEIIAVSETTAADIRRFFRLPRENLTVVHNGIDHGRFHPMDAAAIARALPVTREWKHGWWIYVARLEHPGKNHLRLIEAFEILCTGNPDAGGRLVLAGADWHGASEIHAAVARSPVRDRIHLAGFVDDADIPAWYAGAVGLVFPSLFEGFGLPLVEAMACGCPVVCSGRGAMAEVAGGAALLFNPEDPREIAGAMERAAGPERERLVADGLQRAGAFQWERCARETLAVYRRACGGFASPEAAT